MRPSLFVAQERDAKRNKLGDVLQVPDRHVDFVALAAEVDRAAPRPDRKSASLERRRVGPGVLASALLGHVLRCAAS
jgi:hypothetical protein